MAYSYLRCDRDQLFLLPTDMRQWLPEGHLAWFVIDVVARVDTSAFHARHRNDGAGRPAYDPDMLLALLMYAYCTGVRSSRRIEEHCERDIAYRVICANRVPDHATVARFRAEHQAAIEGCFVDVLVLCAAAGLTSLGIIAIDGTKIAADASRHANRGVAAIRAEVATIVAEASGIDADEDDRYGDARGDELPAELANPISRLARLETALARLEEIEAKHSAEAEAKTARLATTAESAAAEVEVAKARLARADAAEAAERTREARIQAETAAGRRQRGRKPSTDVAAAVIRAEADLAATVARAEASAADRTRREAAAAAAGNKLRGRKPQKDPAAEVARAEAHLAATRERAAQRADAEESPPSGVGPGVRDAAVARAEERLRRAQAALYQPPAPRQPARANTTDPDSRVMKTPDGFVQGYNAQNAVNENQVVIACGVTQEANDCRQLVPMMEATAAAMAAAGIDEEVGCVLADVGYWSESNAAAAGPDRLIATQKSHRQRRAAAELGTTTGPPPQGSTPMDAMDHRLRTAQGAATYARRSPTVEPVFADHKHNRGFRRFSRRGLDAVRSEWSLINTTHNMLKLFRSGAFVPTG